jgi:hypothetical protein
MQVCTESTRSVEVNSQNSGLKEVSARSAQNQHTVEVLVKDQKEEKSQQEEC